MTNPKIIVKKEKELTVADLMVGTEAEQLANYQALKALSETAPELRVLADNLAGAIATRRGLQEREISQQELAKVVARNTGLISP